MKIEDRAIANITQFRDTCKRAAKQKGWDLKDTSFAVWDNALSALEKIRDGKLIEVVRCKDCKMFHKEDSGEKWCGRFDGGIGSDEDGYCSYGEQKDNQPERYVSAAGCMGPEYR